MGKILACFLLVLSVPAAALAAAEHGTLVRGATLYVSPGSTAEKLMQVERGRDMVVLERTSMDSKPWIKVFVTIIQGESQRDVTGWVLAKGVVTVSTPNGDQIIYGEAVDSENQAEQRGGRKVRPRTRCVFTTACGSTFPTHLLLEKRFGAPPTFAGSWRRQIFSLAPLPTKWTLTCARL